MSIKKRKVAWALGAAVIVLGTIATGYAWQPAIAPMAQAPAPKAEQNLITQGARMAELGDCMQCHTA